jgi:shikimate kinase
VKKYRGNVFLIGPMGAGKTTIGRQLSDILRLEFVDSDHEIEARTGADIPWIFDVEGEEGFRAREETVIDELTQRHNIVLATGGGVVMRPANRARLHERGMVVYLQTPVAVQMERTARDRHRPLLQTADPGQRLGELMALRDPLYRETAHIVMATEGGSAREVALRIVHALAGHDTLQ